jgi:hypothetical protein
MGKSGTLESLIGAADNLDEPEPVWNSAAMIIAMTIVFGVRFAGHLELLLVIIECFGLHLAPACPVNNVDMRISAALRSV